ncbi:MAG: hypothetical protein MJZ33_02960 [Paludibacteraceae bacterium]|nr:hypothetical protein [Paludibacteraceae bacterium]
MANEAKKNIEKQMEERILSMGFVKKKKDYYKKWGADIYAVISISSSTGYHVHCRRYGITIEIINEEVQKYEHKLMNEDPKRNLPTLSIQLGYLMPVRRFMEWEFSYENSNEETFSEMFNAIETYAFPFWDKCSDFDRLLNLFLNREVFMSISVREIVLPILYYMRGEKDKGVQITKEALSRMKKERSEDGVVRSELGVVTELERYLSYVERYMQLE